MWSWLFKNWKYDVSLCWQGQRPRCTWSRARWSESVLVAGPPALNITRKKLSMWRNVIWARTSMFQIILPIIVISTQHNICVIEVIWLRTLRKMVIWACAPNIPKMSRLMSLLMRLFHCQRECCLRKWSSCQFIENAKSLFFGWYPFMWCNVMYEEEKSITRTFDV